MQFFQRTMGKKPEIKSGTSNTQLLKSQFPDDLRNITNLGFFQKNVTQEEIVLTRTCFFILSYSKRNLHTAAYYIPKLVRAL